MTLNPTPGGQDAGSPSDAVLDTFETFEDLGVSDRLVEELRRDGVTEPFPIQSLAIPDALAGRDICGKARTGSGKTLAFGIPLVQRTHRAQPRHPHALVLVPTRELAVQVATEISPLAASYRLRLLPVYGGVSLYRQSTAMRSGIDIVIATPGRLNDLLERGDVSVRDVQVLVIDEADQMADLGFMPQVERILDQIDTPHQTLLFSATLDGAVDRLVKRYQDDPVYHEVETPADETVTMQHRFIGVNDSERVAIAADIASGPGRTLLFVRTQRGADRLVRQLSREGVAAGTLHGGMSQPQRERSLRSFSDGSVPVLVATNIAARGIHVDGVDIVVHFDPPEDAKTYLHRSGRTARAGASGVVATLVSYDQERDVAQLRRQAGVREAIVSMEPGDLRLTDLVAWQPPLEDLAPEPSRGGGNRGRNGGGGGNNNGHRGRRWRPGGSGGRRGGNRSGSGAPA